MSDERTNDAWWKPALRVFGELSPWIVVPVIAALIVGKWLDARYGTEPWLFLGLTGMAFFISCFGIVRIVGRYVQSVSPNHQKKKSEEEDSGRIPPAPLKDRDN